MPTLDIYRANKLLRQEIVPDSDLVVLGRDPSCEVVLSDHRRKVSRIHSVLVRLPGPSKGFFVRDLGSLYGTRVNGASIYSKVLGEEDTIEIGDYKLVFSLRSRITPDFRHLRLTTSRVVSGRGSSAALTSRTERLVKGIPFDPAQEELLEEVRRRNTRGEGLSDFASDIVTAALRVVQAEKGFIGLFVGGDPTLHSECGVVNFKEEETIEVSDVDFVGRLAKGEVIQEGATLLVPICRRREVGGFFCLKRGRKGDPFDREEVAFLLALGRVIPMGQARPAITKSSARTNQIYPWPSGLVGRSEQVRTLLQDIRHAALSDLNVMVLGETGSGKELVAHAIHHCAPNSDGPFIARNCSQITETLAEAEIFGYSPQSGIAGADPKGAAGWFERANGGTLFLDEIHRLTPALQDKFLRVLQDKEVWRIGAKSPIRVNVRIVAATDEDPEKAVKAGWFRAPFLYRFGATIRVPALRARKDDIPLLAFYFLDKYASALRSRCRSISHRALRLLVDSDWPGNVRQLEQLIQLGVARGQEVLFSWDIGAAIDSEVPEPVDRPHNLPLADKKLEAVTGSHKTMDEVEREYIKEVLEVTRGNLTRSARLLGYKSRQTLLNKMDRYRIPRAYTAHAQTTAKS